MKADQVPRWVEEEIQRAWNPTTTSFIDVSEVPPHAEDGPLTLMTANGSSVRADELADDPGWLDGLARVAHARARRASRIGSVGFVAASPVTSPGIAAIAFTVSAGCDKSLARCRSPIRLRSFAVNPRTTSMPSAGARNSTPKA